MNQTLARVDRAVAVAERFFIVLLVAVMTVSVFLDALHRVFAAEEGRSARLLAALLPEAFALHARNWIAPALLLLATYAIAVFALARRQRPTLSPDPDAPSASIAAASIPTAPSRGRRWAQAAAITLGLAAATQALVLLLPNGLVFSQQMSLCFMLWIALTGASLAARDRGHIAFELAGKLWPAPLRKPAERIARLIAAAFTIFLAVLATSHTMHHHAEWASSDGTAGLFEAWRVPRFLIYGFLPLPLAIMALRFLAFGVRSDDDEVPAS